MRTEHARRDRHISTSEACHSIISTSFEGRSRGCETGLSLDQALFSESQSPQSADELVVPPNVYLKSYFAGRKNPMITSYMMKKEKLQKDLRDQLPLQSGDVTWLLACFSQDVFLEDPAVIDCADPDVWPTEKNV